MKRSQRILSYTNELVKRISIWSLTPLKNLRIKYTILCIAFSLPTLLVFAQKTNTIRASSPDGRVLLTVAINDKISWSVEKDKQAIIMPSDISLTLDNGKVLGRFSKFRSSSITQKSGVVKSLNYKKATIRDSYTQAVLSFKDSFNLIFRVYNNGVAYRFSTSIKHPVTIRSEEANFNFDKDYATVVPYVNTHVTKNGTGDVYFNSFENTYNYLKISQLHKDTLAFTPILINLDKGKKAAIIEADLEDYPGMFLKVKENGFYGAFAPLPKTEKQGGHNNLQSLVTAREEYIAKTDGNRNFPWRIVTVSDEDKELLNNDLVYLLASPSRVQDPSWIRSGKVAWDWWNDWNIKGVDFNAGINTATYKFYIDFAAAYNIEYVLLDEGWANSLDIMDIVPEINLQEIIDYGRQKNVGIWLWGGWLPLSKKMDEALSKYASMGIKGFKVDFMDRDDQKMVNFYYKLAEKAAQYKLMIDFHGSYKPTGLQRTYPNVVNFEGVYGMEQLKWGNYLDMPKNDVTIPYLRMLAGSLDYTPGAMSNANRKNFRPIGSKPMSQGTRCHQLAMYIIYEAPFSMLSDNPNAYMAEKESTTFIAAVPTVFDETIAIDGRVGEYAVIARRKGDTWYIGGMTDWTERDITLDLSFLKNGNYTIELYTDGVNAGRDGTDYKKQVKRTSSADKIKIHMAPGGGFAATKR